MKVKFEDGSFWEIKMSSKPGFVDLILAAKSSEDTNKLQILSESISLLDFATAVKDLGVELPKV